MPKIIPSNGRSRGVILFRFSPERWAKIKSHIPQSLTAEADARLCDAIAQCCLWFRGERQRLKEGAANAAAMRSPGTRQPAPLVRLARALREAADVWKEVRGVHDDYLGNMALYENLETMAQDAQRRLAAFNRLGEPVVVANPWPEFVRNVAQCCRDVGLEPTATGAVYEGAKPSWFQEFMLALQENLLGRDGKVSHSREAFHAEIAKAMPGDRNTGTARKKIIR